MMTEKEIKALANTLDHLKVRNKNYRDKFMQGAEGADPERKQILMLLEHLNSAGTDSAQSGNADAQAAHDASFFEAGAALTPLERRNALMLRTA